MIERRARAAGLDPVRAVAQLLSHRAATIIGAVGEPWAVVLPGARPRERHERGIVGAARALDEAPDGHEARPRDAAFRHRLLQRERRVAAAVADGRDAGLEQSAQIRRGPCGP